MKLMTKVFDLREAERNFTKNMRAARTTANSLKAALLAICVLLGTQGVFAQSGRANITGIVTDAQGAAIPNATVTATDTATGVATPTTSNQSGVYSLIQLQAGNYTVKAEKEGFAATIQDNVLLVAEQQKGLNFALSVGKVSQQVTVTGQGQLLQTQSAELGQTINARTINELPLNGRNPASLVLLTPGTVDVLGTSAGYSQTYTVFPTEGGASTNGGRQGSTYYLLDGAYNEDNYDLLAAPFPNPDATQEFSVIGNNFDPRYGFTTGGVVSIVTKSGTDSWHGDAFEFLRNGDLNAKNAFTKVTDNIKRNQYGGSIGGPLIKNKLFIFGNYQGTRQSLNANSSTTYVPSDAMRAGDFSALCQTGFDANGICKDRDPTNPTLVANQIWHPSIVADHTFADALANAYPNNFVNPATFNQASVAITNLLPHSTDPLGHLTVQGYPEINNYDEFTVRSDYNINSSQHLSGRAFLNYFTQPPVSISLLDSNRSWNAHWQSYAGTYTWTINPHIVNSLTGSYVRLYDTSNSGLLANGKPVCFSQFINVADTDPIAPCSIENLVVSGGPGGGFSVGQNYNQINRWTVGVSDSLSISKGKHLIVAGVDVLRQSWFENTNWLALPIINFNGGPNGNFTGYGFSDFLLGATGSFEQGGGESNIVHAWQAAPYIADQIKVSPNFTVSAGLRWEPFFAPLASSGRIGVWEPGKQSTRYPNAPQGLVYPGDAGVPSAGMPNTYSYFDPRVGIAWEPKFLPNTSIQAAFGMYSMPVDYSNWNHTGDTAPFSPTYSFSAGVAQTPTTVTPIIPFSDPWSVYAPTNFKSPFPPFATPNYAPPASAPFVLPVTIPAGFAPDFKPGVTQTWNTSIEHQFGSVWLARIAYVGSRSIQQSIPIDANPGIYNTNPALNGQRKYGNFTSVLLETSQGKANYNSAQLLLEHRNSHGLQFQANYTYSKTLDDASIATLGLRGSVTNPICIPCNYGDSALNFPQKFTASFVYEVPFVAGWSRVAKTAVSGWEVSGIYLAQSGGPISVGDGLDNSAAHVGSELADYAPSNTTRTIHVHPGSTTNYLTYTDFAPAAPGTFGNVPKNYPSGPGTNNWDLGVNKSFQFAERYRAQFRLEAFNAFNRLNLGSPVSSLNSGPNTFGHIYNSGASRVVQFAVKFYF